MLILLVPVWLISPGCVSHQHISSAQATYLQSRATDVPNPDPDITALLGPYKAQMDERMNQVIAEVDMEMTKDKPECTLGNWMCDAMMASLRRHGFEADLALSNYGGIRVPYLTAGPLTVGELYELSPFDNLLVIVDMPGDKLDSLFQHIAATEGWPVSGDVRMRIRNKVMAQCMIQGKPLDHSNVYRVAMPDYVANGGDGSKMILPLPRIQTGVLVRDLLIEEAKETQREGRKISAMIEGRTIIEK